MDSLRAKLFEEETVHKKVQEQLLLEKLTCNQTDEAINHHSEEIIKGIPSIFYFLLHFLSY